MKKIYVFEGGISRREQLVLEIISSSVSTVMSSDHGRLFSVVGTMFNANTLEYFGLLLISQTIMCSLFYISRRRKIVTC